MTRVDPARPGLIEWLVDGHGGCDLTRSPGGLMAMFDEPPRYRSYVLAFWEERTQDPETPVAWRFSLQDPRTGQRRGFASLEKVIAFLRAELGNYQDEPPD